MKKESLPLSSSTLSVLKTLGAMIKAARLVQDRTPWTDGLERATGWLAFTPTARKLDPAAGKAISTLIINGTECEPYITADVLASNGDQALLLSLDELRSRENLAPFDGVMDEVCRRFWASKGEMRTSRCTPRSTRR